MPRDTTEGRGRWKSTKASGPTPSHKKAKKWTAIAVLGGLLAVSGGVAVYLLLVFSGWLNPKTRYVPFWVGRYEQARVAPISWMEADRALVRERNRFHEFDGSDFNDPNLEIMNAGVESLSKRKPNEPVVVHVSGYAVIVADEGAKSSPVRILAEDSNPSDSGTMLALGSLLEQFAASPSQKKLLILDIMKPRLDSYDLGSMGTSDGVADVVRSEVDRVLGAEGIKNPGLVLVACAEGQNTVEIESFGGSLFNHHLREALEDPAADRNGDGRITVKELAAYLERVVDRDAMHYRALHQTPKLLGKGKDFSLVSVGAGRPTRAKRVAKLIEKAAEKKEGTKEADKDKAASGEKKGDAAQDSAKEKEKPADSKQGASEGTKADKDGGYPQWLADGWAERKRIWDDLAFFDTPRLFRTLEAHLIRAEQRWRGGEDPAKLREETDRVFKELAEEMKKIRAAEWLTPRSVGQARELGRPLDETLVADLKATLRIRREPDPFAKPEQRAETLAAAVKAFVGKLKGKTTFDLANAVIGALASADERLDAETVKFTDMIVSQAMSADPTLRTDVAELRFLSLLARRAEATGTGVPAWSESTVRRAWDLIVLAERANCRPRSLAWVRGLLDRADALRHAAEVLTLPKTAGYASWKQIDAAWEQARTAYDFVANAQTKIESAQGTLARARALLPAYIPLLEASYQPERETAWLDASAKAGALGALLDTTTVVGEASAPPTRETIEQLNDELAEATQTLTDAVAKLLEPFQAPRIEEIIRACRSEREVPDPKLATRIDAMLSVPVLGPNDRRELWTALRDLDRRLAAITPVDQAETSDATTQARLTETLRVGRFTARANRLAAFIRLVGEAKMADDMDGALRRELASFDRARQNTTSAANSNSALDFWNFLAKRCGNVRQNLKKHVDQKEGDEAADWVAPVDDLAWRQNPVRHGKPPEIRRALAWLGGHYRRTKEDAREPEIAGIFRQAELNAFGTIEAPPEIYPELSVESSSGEQGRLSLSDERNREELAVQVILRAPNDSGSKKVRVSAVKSDDARLRITPVEGIELNLAPQVAQTAKFRVEWIEEGIRPVGLPAAPTGFIVQARLATEAAAYHLPVPLAIVPGTERLQLVLSSAADRLAETPFDLRLRTIADRQKFFVYVRNPSATPRELVVEVLEGDRIVPGTEAKLTVPAGATEKIKAFGMAPIPPMEPLHELAGPLQIRAKDAKTGEVYRIQKVPVEIASPRDYLEVADARFIPPQPGEPNRFELRFRALPSMIGPVCPVAMILDKRWIPALGGSPKEFQLSGSIEPQGGASLYASGMPLSPTESPVGLVPVDVDGLKRAFWFRTRFEQAGSPQRAELINKPRVSFKATPIFKPKEPAKLKVEFEVDDAPSDARLRWQLGRLVDGRLQNDITPFEASAKNRRIAFDARGADGALLFEAASKDWEPEFTIANIRGERILQAKLLAADGRTELAEHRISLVLDDQAPSEIALVAPAEVAKAKKVMPVSASVNPPASGLKEVAFFFGKGNAADFEKAQADNKVFKAKPKGEDGRGWETSLTIPEAATGTLVVSVRALSNVGLAGFATAEVGIMAPKPAADPAEEDAAKAKMPKTGEIAGKITEGDRPQPGLTIALYDLKAKAGTNPKIAEVKSAKDGTYSFKDLPPSSYRVHSTNPASLTQAVTDATVEAGKTSTANLDLVR